MPNREVTITGVFIDSISKKIKPVLDSIDSWSVLVDKAGASTNLFSKAMTDTAGASRDAEKNIKQTSSAFVVLNEIVVKLTDVLDRAVQATIQFNDAVGSTAGSSVKASESIDRAANSFNAIVEPAARMEDAIGESAKNTKQLQAGLNQVDSAGRRTEKTIRKTGTTFSTLTSGIRTAVRSLLSLRNVLIAVVAALTVGRVVSSLRDTARELGELSDVASRLQLPTEDLSELRFIAEQSGIEFQTLASGLRSSQRRIVEFVRDGTGPAAKALFRLNIELEDSEGRLRPILDLLPEFAAQLQKVPDAAERLSLVRDVFNISGTSFLQLFEKTPEQLAALGAEARALGVVFREDQLAPVKELNDAINSLSAAWFGLKAATVQAIAPIATEVINELTGFIAQLKETIPNISETLALALTPEGFLARERISTFVKDLYGFAATVANESVGILVTSAITALRLALDLAAPEVKGVFSGFLFEVTNGLLGERNEAFDQVTNELRTKIANIRFELDNVVSDFGPNNDLATVRTRDTGYGTFDGKRIIEISKRKEELEKLEDDYAKHREEFYRDIERLNQSFKGEFSSILAVDQFTRSADRISEAFDKVKTSLGFLAADARDPESGPAPLSVDLTAVRNRGVDAAKQKEKELNDLRVIQSKADQERADSLLAEKALLDEIARIKIGKDSETQAAITENRIRELELQRAQELISEEDFINQRRQLQTELVDFQISEQIRLRDEILKTLALSQAGDKDRIELLKTQAGIESQIQQLQQQRIGIQTQAQIDQRSRASGETTPLKEAEQIVSGPISGFFSSIITQSATAKEAFLSLVDSMLNAIVNFITQKAVESFFNLLAGGPTAATQQTIASQPFFGGQAPAALGATAGGLAAGTGADIAENAGETAALTTAVAPLTAATTALTPVVTSASASLASMIAPIGLIGANVVAILAPLTGIAAGTPILSASITALNVTIATTLVAALAALTAALTANTAATAVDAAVPLARGGFIHGPNVNRDIINARLMPGEFVVRKAAVRRYGPGFFEALNSMMLPPVKRGGTSKVSLSGQFASGGLASGPGVGGSPTGPTPAFIVADDQAMDRLLNGGANAMMRFFEDNRVGINAALDRQYRSGRV